LEGIHYRVEPSSEREWGGGRLCSAERGGTRKRWRAACGSPSPGPARPDPAKTVIGGATAKRKASAGIGGSDAADRRRTGDRWRSRKAGPKGYYLTSNSLKHAIELKGFLLISDEMDAQYLLNNES